MTHSEYLMDNSDVSYMHWKSGRISGGRSPGFGISLDAKINTSSVCNN